MKKISLIILIGVHLFLLTQLRFTAWPEMFSYPYLVNNGFKLYQDIALPYEPGLVLILSGLYKIFGFNIKVLEYFTWSLIILCDLIIFLISQKIIGKSYYSLLPVIAYILLQPVTQGNMLWFDLAMTPIILLGVLSFIYIQGAKKYLFLGLCLGSAFFIKQQLGIAIALIGLYFLFSQNRLLKLKFFTLGFSIPAAAVFGYIFTTNLVNDYIFWTISVPLFWYPKFPGYTHLPSRNELIGVFLIFTPIIFFVLKLFKKLQEFHIVILLLFIGTFMAAFPRFEFFRMQPAIALTPIFLSFLISNKKFLNLMMITPIILVAVFLMRHELPTLNQSPRFYTDKDLQFTGEILNYSENSKNIYLLGISSLQYVLAEKMPAKPWVDNYVWYLEIPGVQDKVVDGFIKNPPKIIFQRNPSLGNWYDLGVYQPKKVVDYINMNYEKKNIINEDIQVWELKD